MKIERPLIYYNVENGNGRIYTSEDVMPKVKDFLNRKNKIGAIFGELGHPEDSNFISLKNASHKIEHLYECDDTLYGTLNIIDTPKGKYLRENLDKFVFRPRMVGVVNEDKHVNVKEILTFDAIIKENDSFRLQQTTKERRIIMFIKKVKRYFRRFF